MGHELSHDRADLTGHGESWRVMTRHDQVMTGHGHDPRQVPPPRVMTRHDG